MPRDPPSGGSLWHWSLPEGSGLPSSMPSPPSCLTSLFSGSLYKRAIGDEIFWAATVVAAFLICLGVFHSPCQMNHELLCYPFNSAGIITLLILIIAGVLFFLMCQAHSRLFQEGLVTLSFLRGKKLVVLGLGEPSVVWVLGQLYRIFLLSLPGSP